MCGLCGSLGVTHWSDNLAEGEASVLPWRNRLARRARVTAANRLLVSKNLTLTDWQGVRFILRNRTGVEAEITGLGDLWSRVDKMCAIPPDPLDPDFLAAVSCRDKS